mmetsp:Transcript_8259/g.28981  ORF Transcript_8259/g.28981 Transcript_8259/m.28981 type:complete len:492 (+) Transcript_8259:219-1694(+)
MHKYRLVAKKGEGTFSEVLKAQCIKNGKYVAIKCMKNHFDSLDQVNNLREIQALRRLSPHQNIIKLLEVLYDQPTGRLALVFELMDMNIYELIRGRRHYVAEDRVKAYMYQLIKAMDHMHRNGIFHRDIKPENILIMDDVLKLADFGSCRGIYSKQPYTEYISTRWYRAPECLLTDGYYNYKMDMWGVGCVFFEIVSLFPLFPGTNELDQIQKIHNVIGTPPPDLLAKMKQRSQHMDFNFPQKEGSGLEKLIPHVSPDCVELITKLLCYNPDDRLSARQALRHPYFREIRDQEKRAQALLSPDIAAASGLISLPPATSDSGASSSSRARKSKQDDDSLLPSISSKPHGDHSDKENDDGEVSAADGGVKGKILNTLPTVIGTGRSSMDGEDEDNHHNLPPIAMSSIAGKGVPITGTRKPTGSSMHSYASHYKAGKQQTARNQSKPTLVGSGSRLSGVEGIAAKTSKKVNSGGGGKYVSPYSQRYIATQKKEG